MYASRALAAVFVLFWTAGMHAAERLPGADLLSRVRSGHPRLMLLEEQVPALRQSIRENATLTAWYRQVHDSAAELLAAPVVSYQRDNRAHLLGAAREAVRRVYLLGLVYRVEQDERYARRAIGEVLNAARLDSWNPTHFLDTAELTHAVSIGYDWLYAVLSPEERAEIRGAIGRRGLEEGLYFYEARLSIVPRYLDFNWALCNFNWSQVCNGGMTIGALAVAEDMPDLAARILAFAMERIRPAMAEFGPDGGWAEGPRYWEYTTSYTAYFLAALESAIGPDAIEPYLKTPGFDKTGLFRTHVIGPTGRTFNFADSRDTLDRSSQLFWLGRKFNQPVYAWSAARVSQAAPFDILWYDKNQQSPKEANLPLDAYFRKVETVFLRGAWDDPKAAYVAFKGGNNAVNHGHLDLGSFVLDADGRRWALDLGPDEYSLPFYFAWGKSSYYRLKTEGHNTLLIPGQNQRWDAMASVTAFHSEPDRAWATMDLSQAYNLSPGRVMRSIALLERRNVVVQDDFHLEAPLEVLWQMHTEARIELQERSAVLRDGGEALTAHILQPSGAVFEMRRADAPSPEAQQPGVHKLVVRVAAPSGDSRAVIALCPGASSVPPSIPSGLFAASANK